MAQENVERIRDAVVAYNRGDLDAFLDEYWTDDIDYRAVEGALDDHGPIHGKAEMRAYMQDWFDTFDDLTVEPLEVIDRTLGFREIVGDYQRQLFLMDHAGLPLKTVLEQLDLLGEEVVPVLRKEFAALKPAHVPDAPTHASLVAARDAAPLVDVETDEVAS